MAAGAAAVRVRFAPCLEIDAVSKITGSIGEDPPVEPGQQIPVHTRFGKRTNDPQSAGMTGVTVVSGSFWNPPATLLRSDLHKPDPARGAMDTDTGRQFMLQVA